MLSQPLQEVELPTPSLEALQKLISRKTQKQEAPQAQEIVKGVPVYDCSALENVLQDQDARAALEAEIASILLSGAGAVALRGAYQDTTVLDDATAVFETIIAMEKAQEGGSADHFASGANDRVWNSLEKLCLAAPQTFLHYHANPWVDLAARAWLGPAYQMTAQVNVVHPGGAAQEAHCDYHLGFLQQHEALAYPAHIHTLSPQLTLQGAIAHCDMPIASGPTKLLPHSQNWPHNYSHFRHPKVRSLFEENYVQVPLQKGDLLFFSPGLLHAAGSNTTENISRMANLLQISSAFGRAMENIDRSAMCKLLFPLLQENPLSELETACVIAASAEGYAFPSNLDTDPSEGGLAPRSMQAVMQQALAEQWEAARFAQVLDDMALRKQGIATP